MTPQGLNEAKKIIRIAIDKFLEKLNIRILSYSTAKKLLTAQSDQQKSEIALTLAQSTSDPSLCQKIISTKHLSKAQLLQDIFALSVNNFQTRGFFVEFGATDGISLSNTFLLEEQFSWNGILAEPARCWHESLQQNRKCAIDSRCVSNKTGKSVVFVEANQPENSSLKTHFKAADHRTLACKSISYKVQTISLLDLLKEYNAPRVIDFLSIDVEGSELEILEAHDFQSYKFKAIACEHNYSENRIKIERLLTSNGYKKVFEKASLWDDWYVLSDES